MNKEVIKNNMKIEGLSKYACPYEKGIRVSKLIFIYLIMELIQVYLMILNILLRLLG